MAGVKSSPRRFWNARRGLLIVGVLVIAAGIVPAWRQASFTYYLVTGRSALVQDDFEKSRARLVQAVALRPESPEAHYRLAVLYRRTGNFPEYKRHLQKAAKLGWDPADINRQELLLQVQVGRFQDVEQQLQSLITKPISDDGALEVYEALAVGYIGNQRINEAMNALTFWINWRPRDSAPRLYRAQVYEQIHDPDSAAKEYRDVLKFAPQDGRARLALSQLLLRSGDVDEAKSVLEKCLEYDFHDPDVYFGLAECEFRSSRVDEAEAWLKKVDPQKITTEREAMLRKLKKLQADIAQFRGEHEKVVAILTGLVKEWPHDVGVHQTLAQAYQAQGQTELAEKHLQFSRQQVLRNDEYADLQNKVLSNPDDPEPRFRSGEILAIQGMMSDAIVWWHSALRVDPHHQATHEALIKYYSNTGAAEKAARHRQASEESIPYSFDRAWKALQTGDPNALPVAAQQLSFISRYSSHRIYSDVLAAALRNQEGRYAEAYELAAPAVDHADLGLPARLVQAEALVGLRRSLAAVPMLTAIVEVNPECAEAHRLLGTIYNGLGTAKEAEKHWLLVAALVPEDYRPQLELARLHKEAGDFESAVIDYQESLKRKADQPERETVLLELAECLIRQREFAAAEETLQQALLTADRDALLAEALVGLGQQQQAAELAASVLGQNADHVRALVISAEIGVLQERFDEALAQFQRAAELAPYDWELRTKYAQALRQAGRQAESEQQAAEAERLKSLQEEFNELKRTASERLEDAPLRREIAKLAASLGRPELANVWNKAAEVIETKADDAK